MVKIDDDSSCSSSSQEGRKPTSFEGILQNGVSEAPKRNVLADLLEKTVGGDLLNGELPNGPSKRPLEDPEEASAKRVALDGNITLYVSQNGDAPPPPPWLRA